tara:strand:+ start:207 stop:626 length:420 start_codon:yes stop_codon:yes gene_type:complete
MRNKLTGMKNLDRDLQEKSAKEYRERLGEITPMDELLKRKKDKELDKKLDKKLKELGLDKSSKRPTTVQEALAMGWKQEPHMLTSNPPIYFFTKDGKTIRIRGEQRQNVRPLNINKKGGSVKKSKYSKGGGVRSAKYKL